jgi:hypothetical protein
MAFKIIPHSSNPGSYSPPTEPGMVDNPNAYDIGVEKRMFFNSNDNELLPSNLTPSAFDPNVDHIELVITNAGNGEIIAYSEDYTYYKTPSTINPTTNYYNSVEIDVESDLETYVGSYSSNGIFSISYSFFRNKYQSSPNNKHFFIKEISPNRKELKVSSVAYPVANLLDETNLPSNNNTPHFYILNFGENKLVLADNIIIDSTNNVMLVHLYEPLPSSYKTKASFYIVTEVADPLVFTAQYEPEVSTYVEEYNYIKGPNVNLPIKDRVNNSSNYISYEQLLTTGLSTSQNQILSYLKDKSINISVNYAFFNNFVHFSSARARIENFYYKIQLLEQYNSLISSYQINIVSSSISSSVNEYQTKIDNLIQNFDGFEYYLYFSSGSNTYPKGNSTPPYNLYYSLSPEAITWYNDQISSASLYDDNNPDILTKTIPSYLRNDPQNDPYSIFIEMVGQHYDNIWLYYKDVTNRYNGDNRLNYGISKDLVADAIRSFGLKIYQNNFSTNDLFNAFAGYNIAPSGSYVVENGNVYITSSYIDEGQFGYFVDDYVYVSPYNELITNYITASQEAFFEPLDDVNKEIYKRIYHNLPLLLKQKGTVAGLRNLINVYGIPDTILRISEFGGRDRDETTYDYFYERYNYSTQNSGSSPKITTAWTLNTKWASSNNVPECIQFRFKTETLPTQSLYGIWGLTNGPLVTAITLRYTGSGYFTSSYEYPNSGSKTSPEWQYAILDLIPDVAGNPNDSASVYLPFYDNNWWSVMVNRSGSTLTLYAGNKLEYNGYDGNTIGFLASSSTPLDTRWTLAGSTGEFITVTSYNTFTGSLQEIRYWATSSNEGSFKDFIMNPSSIDIFGTEDNTYADKLAFRLPLGNELYTGSVSIHPKVTGSWIATQSFASSNAANYTNLAFTPNTETFFLNSPIAGLRNRITDKIQIVSSSYPSLNLEYTQSGNILTPYQSIRQHPLSQNSETPDVNALEVAFSPTNEIDDDIISSLGYFNIGEYIGDPRQISSSATSYPDLNRIRDTYFQKYFANYTLYDYIRLIKFFDNSLFKMIKDFVPARTNLRSGVVVKQHLLERNKYPQPQMEWENVTYSGSIDTAFITGSTGGTFNEFNNLYFTQSWYETTIGPTGSTQLIHNDQSEFYNGELQGTLIEASNGELNEANIFKYPSVLEINYDIVFYKSDITPLNNFLNINTSPNQGEIYLWFDTGSILNPGQSTPTPGGGGFN